MPETPLVEGIGPDLFVLQTLEICLPEMVQQDAIGVGVRETDLPAYERVRS
jgi:hypothetical protein